MSPLLSRLSDNSGLIFNNISTGSAGIFGSTPTLVGTVPGSGLYYAISPSPTANTSGIVYVMRQSLEPNGTGTMYVTSNYGNSWTTGASITGEGSGYGFGLVSISDTIIAAQHRGYFYRSTNSGSSFSTVLTTSGGQNNFFNMSWDGTYGMCGGYSQHVFTSNSWVSASATTNTLGISMATAPLQTNGNRFLKAGLGSSGSPAAAYHCDNNLANATTVIAAMGNNSSYAGSNLVCGVNFVAGNSSTDMWYSTYPSTTYINVQLPALANGYITVTDSGVMCVPTQSGLYKYTAGGSFTRITTDSDIQDVKSIGNSVVWIRGNGNFYGVDL